MQPSDRGTLGNPISEREPSSDIFDETSVYLRLAGFSETLRALGMANHEDVQTDFAALFAFLADASDMMVAELTATHDAEAHAKDATVTIGRGELADA